MCSKEILIDTVGFITEPFLSFFILPKIWQTDRVTERTHIVQG